MAGEAQTVVHNLVYFDRWMHPVGADIVAAADGVALRRLSFDDPPEDTWHTLETAHGYQMLPSTETRREFHPSRAFLQRCPDLLCISTSGAGYDMAACTEAGVLVVNQGGANAESVAQHAIGMMLVLCKRTVQSDNAIRRPDRDWTRFDYSGHELTGRTLGIVGLDVFEAEPPAHDHPLLRFDNVIVSPHNAGVTSDSLYNMAEWAALQWLGVFRGLRPSRLVNPEAWERYAERYARILGEPVSG